jgi:hypothetical protein
MSNITISMDTRAILEIEEEAKQRGISKSAVIQKAVIFYLNFVNASDKDTIIKAYDNLDAMLTRRGWEIERRITQKNLSSNA